MHAAFAPSRILSERTAIEPGFISILSFFFLGRFVRHKLKFEGDVHIDNVAAARPAVVSLPVWSREENYCLSDLKAPDRLESR
ncbi:hypothetical protein DAA51_37850 [Bradyrhizobium sp. WBAH10]|nr:hypothetical protein [Bradyrhizobium sp. WBAH30]MDD1546339.1 hypothetical protein [Bradyrhizobium sp. WBAH41]MDD1560503.1 hypothetical protein [Bradyrhizobium sp. WBAH23]MDD1567345.1 hypothetical protein [Bradyrhizobium sp. WBAH33]MDD1594156.1 hypothetical protein [Bradyrhizobium sp. WBAH42]NRB90830.1 hypothetical protein [Bradyrhizobium sp. WBAH10]QCJ93519.1 hypothetical protein DAA57_37610 [Bradyrhizobium yuanmingense]